jgi:hypothetical protein
MNLDLPAGPHGVGGLLFLDGDGDIRQFGMTEFLTHLRRPLTFACLHALDFPRMLVRGRRLCRLSSIETSSI